MLRQSHTTRKRPRPPKAEPKLEEPAGRKVKLSFKEKQELDGIESEIAKLEAQKADVVHRLNGGAGTYEQLQEWALEVQNLENRIEERTARWVELSDRA